MSERRPATYEELCGLADNVVGEIVDGELFASPRPAPLHANAKSCVGFDLAGFHLPGDEPGGWWLLDEPELHLRGDVLVPDLAGWRRERMPRLPATSAFELVPDWVCEVLSPSTARLDRLKKMAAYAEHGVPYAWLVDPLAKTVEVYRLHEGHWLQLTVAHEGEQRLPPFEVVALDPSRWWLED